VTAAVSDRFDGRRALVTGGASGIGRASAELLLERGAQVAVLDREADPIAEAKDELGAAVGVAADVRDGAAVGDALGRVVEALGGPPEVLVNAAGVYRIAAAADIDETGWDEVLDTNLNNEYRIAHEILGMSMEDIAACNRYAFEASFLPEIGKK